jgi:hypothetical protein
MAIPPRERPPDDRLSLCHEAERAYIGVHAIDLPKIEAMMQRPRSAAKPLAEFTHALIAETLAARGMGETSLIVNWPAIVGRTIAQRARPIELRWPPRGWKRDPEAGAAAATLVLRIEGEFALEAQHSAAVIIDRVNAHLGWRCVGKIAYRQGPLSPLKERPSRAPAPSDAAQAAGRAAASSIEDEGLREALARLGARAIDKSARRPGPASTPPAKGK